jgi:CubicO group peptidase (beta-lactamase class C family)
LGLGSTAYDAGAVDPERLAIGHHRAEDQWVPEPFSGPGAYSSIGGVLSDVEDLARWVAWLADAFPPRDAADAGPLSRAARRTMQVAHIDIPPVLREGSSRGRLTVLDTTEICSYGYGLFVNHDPTWGNIVQHSGGYPGYGTNMRWHVDSGIGVVVLANGRYAPSLAIADRVLRIVLEDAKAVGRTVVLWPEVLAFKRLITERLLAGADPFDPAFFSQNVAMDQPFPARRADLAKQLELVGPLREVPEPAVASSESEAHAVWSLAGERGALRCEIRLTPQATPLVQTLKLAAEPTVRTDDVRILTPTVAPISPA